MWHLYEARRYLDHLAVGEKTKDAAALERWLVGKCRRDKVDRVAVRDIQKGAPRRLRAKAGLSPALEALKRSGRVRKVKEGRAVMVLVNPGLLEETHET